MMTEIRFNGSGMPRVYLTPASPIEKLAITELVDASSAGQTVSLTMEGNSAVLTVKNQKWDLEPVT